MKMEENSLVLFIALMWMSSNCPKKPYTTFENNLNVQFTSLILGSYRYIQETVYRNTQTGIRNVHAFHWHLDKFPWFCIAFFFVLSLACHKPKQTKRITNLRNYLFSLKRRQWWTLFIWCVRRQTKQDTNSNQIQNSQANTDMLFGPGLVQSSIFSGDVIYGFRIPQNN